MNNEHDLFQLTNGMAGDTLLSKECGRNGTERGKKIKGNERV